MLTAALGKFVAETRYESIPADVRDTIKLRILDLLGAALAGYQVKRHVQLLPLLDSTGSVTTWGLGRGMSLRDAVLFNAFLSHSMYLEDGSRFSGGHPSSVVIPSAIAFAEKHDATGQELIAAVTAGYDVFLRLARAIYPSTLQRGFQSTSVTGAMASAAAASSLMKHSAAAAQSAVAIGAILGVGLIEASTSSSSQPIQVARASESGAVAAQFAGQGAIGAPNILERGFLKAFADGASSDRVTDGLGTRYCAAETYLKVHGGCRGNHAPVDLIRDMTTAHGILPDRIASILVRVDSMTDKIAIHEPVNGTQAQYCISFAVAVALLKGDASIFQYTDAVLAEPEVRGFMKRVTVELDRSLDAGFPEKRACSAVMTLTDGRRLEGYIDNAKGEPEHPFSAADVERKFLMMSERVLGVNSGRVRDLVMSLEEQKSIKPLTQALHAQA